MTRVGVILRLAGVVIAGGIAVATGAQERAASAPPSRYGEPIGLADARKVSDAAQGAAARLGIVDAIAVVEPSGALVLVHRMDGVHYGAVDVAVAKASTAARFRRETKFFDDAVHGGRLAVAFLPGVTPLEGGVPLVRAGRIVGAVGVSGGSGKQDSDVATAAASAL